VIEQPGAATAVTPIGRRSTTVTLVATDGPAFVAPIVTVVVVPAFAVEVVHTFVARTSATVVTVASAVAELFDVSGSPAVEMAAVLVLSTVADDATVPLMVAVRGVPGVTDGQVQVTSWPAIPHVPPVLGTAEVMVMLLGTVSDNVASADTDGPRLVATST
jgi:hypothetical protein